ncbi:MAG: acetylglutamate kinase [Cyclobacteriaceae bacterium]|nr:acetylglutamate kinase [Cyclobacteriaceae bacterium]
MKKLLVVKIGGNVTDDNEKLHRFLEDFSQRKEEKILIHGGGQTLNMHLKKMGVEPKMVDGRRITDAETLDAAVMIYAGLTNKKIVSILQGKGVNALGLTGADGNIIVAHKRPVADIDYGYVGDIDEVNFYRVSEFISRGMVPVFAPITHNKAGQLFNTNADTIAAEVAIAASSMYDVHLVYCFGLSGVMENDQLIESLTLNQYKEKKENGIISGGMFPKLHNAFRTLNNGVRKATICHYTALNPWHKEEFVGTKLTLS